MTIGCFALVWLSLIGLKLRNNSEFEPARMARIRVLGLRDHTLHLDDSNNVTFNLLYNGCPVGSPAHVLTRDGSRISTVSFSMPVRANGYFLEIGGGPVQSDPVRWIVEVSSTDPAKQNRDGAYTLDNQEWTTVGASAWQGPYPVGELFPHLEYPTPALRGQRITIDCRPTWTWLMAEVFTYSLLVLGWLFYGACGWLHQELAAVSCISCMCAFNAILHLIAGVGAWSELDWRSGTEWWMQAVPDTLLTVSIVFFQRRIIHALIITGGLKIAVMVCSSPPIVQILNQ